MEGSFKFYVHYEDQEGPAYTHKFVWERASEEPVGSLINVCTLFCVLPSVFRLSLQWKTW
jgi:hypothetical protein